MVIGAKKQQYALVVLRSLATRARAKATAKPPPVYNVHNITGMSSRNTEQSFEEIIRKEATYRKAIALRDILREEPEQVMSLGPAGLLSRKVGKKKARILSKFIREYHTLFDSYQDEERLYWFGFSEQAQELLEVEKHLEKAYEAMAVDKVRKLLMMCVDKRLHVAKIAHLRRDFGLPEDFQKRLVYEYPQYFRVFQQPDGPVLELTSWDSSLAVTALESSAAHSGLDMPRFKFSIAKGYTLTLKQRDSIESFQALPFLSPYTNLPHSNVSKPELEKRRVIVLHEILSMTNEKRTIFDYLTHFRKELMLPKSVMALLLKFHRIFYVSRRGIRLTVFLKESYDGTSLTDKNEWVLLKDRYLHLMAACKKRKKKPDKIEETSKSDCLVAATTDLGDESEEESTDSEDLFA